MSIQQKINSLKLILPSRVKLIAVSKYSSTDDIRIAYDCGLRDFGENRVQDAQNKKASLADLSDINWHLIGSLQSNKVKAALQTFNYIHSIDRLELALRVDKMAAELQLKPKVLLQVKLAPDPNKAGFEISDLFDVLPKIDCLNNICVEGLMTILPLGLTDEKTHTLFSELFSLKEKIQALNFQNIEMKELSMGMSSDFEQAIKAGATMVRIGKALFQ